MSDTVTFDTSRGIQLSAAAIEFNIPRSTLRRWCVNGDLPAWKRRGVWLVDPLDIVSLIKHNQHDPRDRHRKGRH